VCCVKHQVNLVDVCSQCDSSASLLKALPHECSCGAEYKLEYEVETDKHIWELQRFIEYGIVPTDCREQLMPENHGLTLDQRISLVTLFSRLTPNYDVKKTGTSTKLNSVSSALDALQDVARGLLGGKAMFIALLDMLKKMGSTGHKVDQFTRFYRLFYKEAVSECFLSYKAVLENEEKKRCTYTTRRNKLFSEETINGNLWIPLKLAAKEFSIGASKLRLATKEGLIACNREQKGERTFSLLYRPHIEARIYFIRQQLNATEAAILLGVTKSQMQMLCHNGEFVSAIPPERGICALWRISKSEVNDYLATMTPEKDKLCGETILLPDAMRKYGGDIPELFLSIIRAVRAGKVKCRYKHPNLGLRSLEVCLHQLVYLIQEITPLRHLSATKMAKKLKLHPEFMSQLVHLKLIKSYSGVSSVERTVPLQFAHQFKKRFVVGAKLAEALELSPRYLYRYLAELGVNPFDCEKSYKLRSKLYLRQELWDVPMISEYVRIDQDWNSVGI
jgi:AraC-like DNA-binding protein